ncbi:MAG: 3-isopropylmalate dehydratase small subunit [Acidobacteriota bacterium]
MQPIRVFEARYVTLPNRNVDTDQIIPARYLKATTKSGLGEGLFADWRYDDQGHKRPDFILNQPQAGGAEVLVAGDNFGCGSSREHAPWALIENGFRAVVSTSIADIFSANALKNGLLPVTVGTELHRRLVEQGTGRLTIDLERQTIALDDGSSDRFAIDPFAKHCLLEGVDELGFLLQQAEAIAGYEAAARSAAASPAARSEDVAG